MSDNWNFRLQPSIGIDHVIFDAGSNFKVDQFQPLVEIRAESDWKLGEAITLTAGADFILGQYDFTVDLPFNFEYAASYDPLAEREPVQLSGKGIGLGPDMYINATISPLPDRDLHWLTDAEN